MANPLRPGQQSKAGRKHAFLWETVCILLVATLFRVWAIDRVPPGLSYDEVTNWLIVRDILDGHPSLYFTRGYGHEPLFHYLQATMGAAMGDHWLALRYPSMAMGLLSVAAVAVLTHRLFGRTVALLTAAYMALDFWPVFYSRVALRAHSLPFFAALAAYFSFRGFESRARTRSPWINPNYLAFGLLLGLSFYTYMASRMLPFILAGFLVYLAVVHRPELASRWRGISAGLGVAMAVAAPLVIWLCTHPGAEERLGYIQGPLDRLLAGDPSYVWANLKANLGMFAVQGDLWALYNVSGRPVFDRLNGVLFYAGVAITFWRWRDYRYALLPIWLMGSLVPSILTKEAPSSIRDILGVVVTFSFPALALARSGDLVCKYLAGIKRLVLPILYVLPLFYLGVSTAHDYLIVWPREPIAQFNYHADLTAAARQLDTLGSNVPTVVAGLQVHSTDIPLLELFTRRDVSRVRVCDTRQTLVVPGEDSGRLLVPNIVPLDADLLGLLTSLGGQEVSQPGRPFREFSLPQRTAVESALADREAFLPDGARAGLPAAFDGYLALVGTRRWSVDGQLVVLTGWRVEMPPPAPIKVFLHMLDAQGNLCVQYDGLESSPRGWQVGDLVIQKHVLDVHDVQSGVYTPAVGLYWAPDGPRLPVYGVDRLFLSPVQVP